MCMYEQVQTPSARKSGEGNTTTKGFRVKEVHDQSYTAIRYICYAKKKTPKAERFAYKYIYTICAHKAKS